MKVCVIGKGSYIGNHIDKWLTDAKYDVVQFDVQHCDWKSFDFAEYDVLIQVAGIVHQPKCADSKLYKRVNTDLPIEIATKYKNTRSKKSVFVFLSTMAVYGTGKRLQKNIINAETPVSPLSLYGKSKRDAEIGLLKLQDDDFNVVIIRPPNVYGKNCKGGYIPGFVNVVKKLPVIPKAYTDIKQSMLYIDNLCELIRLLIEHEKYGIFMPQDKQSVSAIDIIDAISNAIGKHIIPSNILGVAIRLSSFLPIIQKAYGGVEYDHRLSEIDNLNYCIVPFKEAISRTLK